MLQRGKGCGGLAVFDIVKDEFMVYNQCDFSINHDNVNFEKFEKFFLQNQLDSIDMSLKKYQRYYFRSLFKNYEASDIFTAIDKFKLKFDENIELKLTDNEINQEKNEIIKIERSDKFEDNINNIGKNIDNFNTRVLDVEYKTNYLNKNNSKKMEIKKEEKNIFWYK